MTMRLVISILSIVPSVLCCGRTFQLDDEKTSFNFTSENYPKPHPATTYCIWIIYAPSEDTITLFCHDIHILNTEKCVKSALSYEVGGTNQKQTICDQAYLFTTLKATFITVTFISQRKTNDDLRGVSCSVSFIRTRDSGCLDNLCGTKLGRTVGEPEAAGNEYTWLAVLKYSKFSFTQYCGGSLIGNEWVLTASHCVEKEKPKDITVRLVDYSKPSAVDTSRNFDVAEIIMHENYDTVSMDNDIALIRLIELVIFSSGISPICLPFDYVDLDLAARVGSIISYGITLNGVDSSTLMEVDLPFLTPKQCASTPPFSYGPEYITKNMICTYDLGNRSCQGESGGALVWKNNSKQYVQMGIVSWSLGCDLKDYPAVYTKVTNYLHWITFHTGIDSSAKI